MALTYIIEAPAYNKNVGGFCALHYLADRLIHFGASEVYLTTNVVNPRWQAKTIDLEYPFFLGNTWADCLYQLMSTLKRHVVFNTFKRKLTRLQKRLFPTLLWRYFDRNTTVVICGEAFVGVPFGAKHVVRWIMNTPGVCGGDGIFGPNDHIFQYHPWYLVDQKYQVRGLLTAIDLQYQLNTYQNKHRSNRQGGAYLIRKGHAKKHNQHPNDFVHADPILERMTDEEAADFFNRIETLVSYDDMTWISVQAALCGCNSIIIPGVGERSKESLTQVNRLPGLAYGWDDESWAKGTVQELRPYLEMQNNMNLQTILDFMQYCQKHIMPKASLG